MDARTQRFCLSLKRSKNTKTLLLCAAAIFFTTLATQGMCILNVRYVKSDAEPGGDGLSWDTAYHSIQDAITDLDDEHMEKEVWVARGTYTASNSDQVLDLKDDIDVYGGFVGNETERNQRDWENNQTILDGQGLRRVVRAYYFNSATDDAILDGFTIINGVATHGAGLYCSHGDPLIANCTFINNRSTEMGGGIYVDWDIQLMITGCTFLNNTSPSGGAIATKSGDGVLVTNSRFIRNNAVVGGALLVRSPSNNQGATIKAINCYFTNNSASTGGVAAAIGASMPVTFMIGPATLRFQNCTIAANTAYDQGSAAYLNDDGRCYYKNCIVWDNTNYPENVNAEYSCIQGDVDGTGNIDSDPLLSPVDGRPLPGSPCIDQGTNDVDALESDLNGVARVQNSQIDMGAFEFVPGSVSTTVLVHLGPGELIPLNPTVSIGSSKKIKTGETLNVYPGTYELGFARLGNWSIPTDQTITIPETGAVKTYLYTQSPGNYMYYVNGKATQGGDGSSWDSAFTTIQDAVDAAELQGGGEIWVAQGSYSEYDRETVVTLEQDVSVYGGFTGNETDRLSRDWVNHRTIIDGKKYSRGVYGAVDSILDGFIITNCQSEKGAGMYNEYCHQTVANCCFISNEASEGGAVFNQGSKTEIINSLFVENHALTGGGVFNFDSNCLVTNSTFWKNTDSSGGNGISDILSTSIVQNSIFWGGGENQIDGEGTQVTYSCVQGGYEGTGNISDDPQLSTADLRPLESSPCIDTGNNSIENVTLFDFHGNDRIQNSQIDMGACEYEPDSSTVNLTVNLAPQEVLGLNPKFQLSNGEWHESGTTISLYPGEYYIQFTREQNWDRPTVNTLNVTGDNLTMRFEYTSHPGNFIWYVDDDATGNGTGRGWANAFTDIQSAVDMVFDIGFGEIWVAQGNYTGTGDQVVNLRHGVQLYGGFRGDETSRDQRDWDLYQTVIDGQGTRRCVSCFDDVFIDGFILSNGTADKGAGLYTLSDNVRIWHCVFDQNYSISGSGAGLYCENGSMNRIFECSFINNAASKGAGMYLKNQHQLQIDGCLFQNNSEDYALFAVSSDTITLRYTEFSNNQHGALYLAGVYTTILDSCRIIGNTIDENGAGVYIVNQSRVQLNDCFFSGNVAQEGGAIYCTDSLPTIVGTTFRGNQAIISGGAVYGTKSSLVFRECLFEENSADMDGGAIFTYYTNSTDIVDCYFINNQADAAGGALDFSRSGLHKVINSQFVGNSAVNNGGAIFTYQGSNPSVLNCTFTGNIANSGGAIYKNDRGDFLVSNCILWENSSEIAFDTEFPISVSYSCIQGGFEGEGNIDADPLFVDLKNGDYRLTETSPCLDTGTLENAPNFDIRGILRPQGAGVDMGIYEYHHDIDQGNGEHLAILDLSNGWTFTRPNPYEDILGEYIPQDRKWDIYFLGNTNSFGFLESPLLSIIDQQQKSIYTNSISGQTGPNALYRSRMLVSSNQEDLNLVPVIRQRVSCESFQRSDLIVATSENNGNFSPGIEGKIYQNFFTVPVEENQIRLDLDVLSFNPLDAPYGVISLQYAEAEYLGEISSLSGETVIMSEDLVGTTPIGWNASRASTQLLAGPNLFSNEDGLLIRGVSPDTDPSEYPAAIFGCWNHSITDEPLQHALYCIRWTVGSDIQSGSENELPTFRLRINDSSLKFASLLNIDSALTQGQQLPTAEKPVTYESWFQVPPEIAGNDWLLSFDYLYVNKAGYATEDDPRAALILEAVEVVRYDIP